MRLQGVVRAVTVCSASVGAPGGSVGASVGSSGSGWSSSASISSMRIPLSEGALTRCRTATSASVYRRGAVVALGEGCRPNVSDHLRMVEPLTFKVSVR